MIRIIFPAGNCQPRNQQGNTIPKYVFLSEFNKYIYGKKVIYQRQRMLLRQLEYILAVDTHRNFTRAADVCCVTQPTLSQQIKSLEDHLDIVIFSRNRAPVEPTREGVLLLEQARVVVSHARKLELLARQLKHDL